MTYQQKLNIEASIHLMQADKASRKAVAARAAGDTKVAEFYEAMAAYHRKEGGR